MPGCELSTRWQGINIHVVALMPGGLQGPMIEGLEQQREARIKRAEVIAERLEKMGLPNALEKPAPRQAATARWGGLILPERW